MVGLSAVDVAIKRALHDGTIVVKRRRSERLGSLYWAICDNDGTITVALSQDDAFAKVGRAMPVEDEEAVQTTTGATA